MIVREGKDNRLPVFAWVDDFSQIESSAWEQIDNLCRLPFAIHHIAIMPDVHAGFGMPIGGVLATDANIIVPNAVGSDIYCGLSFCYMPGIVRAMLEKQDMVAIAEHIRKCIPVGFDHHSSSQPLNGLMYYPLHPDDEAARENARYQIGTLGGGNHFIEIQYNEKGDVALMVHCGSRNIGAKFAQKYNKIAVEGLGNSFKAFMNQSEW